MEIDDDACWNKQCVYQRSSETSEIKWENVLTKLMDEADNKQPQIHVNCRISDTKNWPKSIRTAIVLLYLFMQGVIIILKSANMLNVYGCIRVQCSRVYSSIHFPVVN